MRIVFLNLQKDRTFIVPLMEVLTGYAKIRKRTLKERFFLDELLKENIRVGVVVSKYATSFGNRFVREFLMRKVSDYALREARLCLKWNHIPLNKVDFITSGDELDEENDIVIGPVRWGEWQACADILNAFHGRKIIDMTHIYATSSEAQSVRAAAPDAIFAQTDFRKTGISRLFNKNYAWFDGKIMIFPFAFAERFRTIKDFDERQNKAIAIGTLAGYTCGDEYTEVYGEKVKYQPSRQMMFDNREENKEYYDSYISEYFERKRLDQTRGIKPIRMIKTLANIVYFDRQTNYFKFDMVEKFNEYKMAICGEDIHGNYGVGFVEAMACGCAYIGLDYDGYKDLGLISGVHFIGYDGTIDDLADKIRYYQRPENQGELKQIAAAGQKFVQEHFNASVAGKFVIDELKAWFDMKEGMNES